MSHQALDGVGQTGSCVLERRRGAALTLTLETGTPSPTVVLHGLTFLMPWLGKKVSR